jgi:hypothetical protein
MRGSTKYAAGLAVAGAAAVAVFFAHPATSHVIGPPPAVTVTQGANQAFELFRESRIFTRGSINGRAVDMMVDSGAGLTTVDAAYARRIGLVGNRTIPVRGTGGPVEGHLASGVSLAIGGLRLDGLTVLILDLALVAKEIGRPIDVIVGNELFENSVVSIDFDRRILGFAVPSDFSPPAGAVRLPLQATGDGPRKLPVSIDGLEPVLSDFDLGHGGAIILSRDYWEKQPKIASLPYAETVSGGVGGLTRRRIATLRTVTLAGRAFADVPAILNQDANDLPPRGANVGIDLLGRFRLTIDYAHDALYLIPGKNGSAVPKDRAGMHLELDGDRLRVLYVSPISPAFAGGWRVGDEILSVDGGKVSPTYYSQPWARWTNSPAGSRIDLVRADGKHQPIVLRDYF